MVCLIVLHKEANKEGIFMKKIVTCLILFILILTLSACSDDRSFSIDEVTIDAQIQEDGSISEIGRAHV